MRLQDQNEASLFGLWLLTLDRAKYISISATLFPTQDRTPTPNGMKLYGWCWKEPGPPMGVLARSQRSGTKCSGSGNSASS